jgi:hypothetical protein
MNGLNGSNGPTGKRLFVLAFFIFHFASLNTAQAATRWSLQPTASGFQWVSPSGAVQCKYAAVSLVDKGLVTYAGNPYGTPPQFTNVVPAKYPSWPAWAAAQNDRLKSWGFNAAGMYSYTFSSSNHPAGGLPFTIVFQVSGHATRDDYPYHIKNLNHNYAGMVCGNSFWLPGGGGQIDAYDPGLASAYMADLANEARNPWWDLSSTILYITEEADDLFGIDNLYTHEDFGFDVLNGNPRQDVSAGGSHAYADHAVYAKLTLRDFLAGQYGCPGSADPSAANYCGDAAAAAALDALNNAWFGRAVYTTWNTSDAGGLAGVHAGTYASYGQGAGLLDENGRNTVAAATKSNCNLVKMNDAWSVTPAIKADLHRYVVAFVQTYAQKLSAAWAQPVMQPHPPVVLPLYNGPSYVYTAAAPYFDGFWISAGTSDVPRIIAASSAPGGKSMPLIFGDYDSANPDSPWSTSHEGGTGFNTQGAKGAGMVAAWRSALQQQDANGKYVVVGVEHWPFYDQANEQWDGGLVTADGDNPYDGSASNVTATPGTVWQANHAYQAPALIYDGTNYEALSGDLTGSCASGSSAPAWNPKMGGATSDGTCLWRNEGPYPLKPEAGIANTATIPGKAYGDAITPIADFLNGGICDSGSPPPPAAPVIYLQPEDILVTAGSAAAFTISASGTPSPNYQWQAMAPGGAWRNIGTNSNSLAMTNVQLSDSGTQVRCLVSNGIAPDATSRIATLTVIPAVNPGPTAWLPPVLDWPATVPINRTLQIGYDMSLPVAQVQWDFVRVTNSGQSSGSGSMRSTGAQSLPPGAVVSFTTSGGAMIPAEHGLTVGTYQVTVQLLDAGAVARAQNGASLTLVNPELNAVKVHPNPWRKDKHVDPRITFDGLTINTDLKIFTVSGHLVRSLPKSSGSVSWDLNNDAGDPVASGIYLFLIKDNQGNQRRGKVAIIR